MEPFDVHVHGWLVRIAISVSYFTRPTVEARIDPQLKDQLSALRDLASEIIIVPDVFRQLKRQFRVQPLPSLDLIHSRCHCSTNSCQ